MSSIRLDGSQIIKEFERRGARIEPHRNSAAGFAVKVGSSGAVIPDWLMSNLEDHIDEVSDEVSKRNAVGTERSPDANDA